MVKEAAARGVLFSFFSFSLYAQVRQVYGTYIHTTVSNCPPSLEPSQARKSRGAL